MNKYRAVLLVPSIVEFETYGSHFTATAMIKDIAKEMGKTTSVHPRHTGAKYVPVVLECVLTEGSPHGSDRHPRKEMPPELDIEFHPE